MFILLLNVVKGSVFYPVHFEVFSLSLRKSYISKTTHSEELSIDVE